MSAPRYTPEENEAAFRELRRQTVKLCVDVSGVLANGPPRPEMAVLAALHVLVKRSVEHLREEGFDIEECFRDAQRIARTVLGDIRAQEKGGDA